MQSLSLSIRPLTKSHRVHPSRARPSVSQFESRSSRCRCVAVSIVGVPPLLLPFDVSLRARAILSRGKNDDKSGGANSHDHLLTAKQGVTDELASSQGDGGVDVRHLVGRGADLSVEMGWR